MKVKQAGIIGLTMLFLGVAAQAETMNQISPYPLGERSVFSDRATNARLAPVGHVCVEGQKCEDASAATVASASAGGGAAPAHTPMTPKEIFSKHCTMCHSTGAAGAPVFGNKKDWAPHIAKGLKTLYHSALHGFQAMPPRGMCTECTDAEIEATVRYMVDHSK
jgi:cytochrome c5